MGTALLKARKRLARHFTGLVNAWNDAGTIAARQNVSRLQLLAEGAALMLGGEFVGYRLPMWEGLDRYPVRYA
jgi:hypothetical protein